MLLHNTGYTWSALFNKVYIGFSTASNTFIALNNIYLESISKYGYLEAQYEHLSELFLSISFHPFCL